MSRPVSTRRLVLAPICLAIAVLVSACGSSDIVKPTQLSTLEENPGEVPVPEISVAGLPAPLGFTAECLGCTAVQLRWLPPSRPCNARITLNHAELAVLDAGSGGYLDTCTKSCKEHIYTLQFVNGGLQGETVHVHLITGQQGTGQESHNRAERDRWDNP